MDRQEFLCSSARVGLGCGAALLLGRSGLWAAEEVRPSPCQRRVEFVRAWVQDFMANMDAQLDQATREKLMEANGRACFEGAIASGFYGSAAPQKAAEPVDIDAWFKAFQQHVGPERLYREGAAIHFKYGGNPRGLKIADGYCLCPILEDGPRQLSPTYCHCSVGYVTASCEHSSGRKVKVELADSLRRGGKECHFILRFV